MLNSFFLKYPAARQFSKFALVGSIGTAIDFGILNLGVEILGLAVYLAATVSFFAAMTHNFLLNKYWTFSKNGCRAKFINQCFKYFSVSMVGLFINLGVMFVLIEGAGLWYNWAKVFATGLVIMWNFSINRQWTFKK
ncbi:MAG TPA: GtrA family protein [Candidatus Bipolaricaulota bacterium]|nr:GtrA family protein [Candidatus Bipolaricaulota bacterium]